MIQWENKRFGANRPLPFTNYAALLLNSLCHSFLIYKMREQFQPQSIFYEDKKKKGKKIDKVLCI